MSHQLFVPSEVDVFADPINNYSFDSYYDEECMSTIPLDTNSSLVFNVPGYQARAKSLTELHLGLKFQILKADGTLYEKTDKIQTRAVNNILNSLFKSIKLYLNNTQVYSIDSYNHLKGLIESYLNYSHTSTLGQYSAQGLFPIDNQKKLAELTQNSQLVDLYGRLNIVNLHKILISNVDLKIRLDFNEKKIILIESELNASAPKVEGEERKKTQGTFKVSECRLYVRSYYLKSGIDKQIEATLRSSPAVYDFKKAVMLTYNLPENTSSATYPMVYSGLAPELVIFFMLQNDVLLGNNEDSAEFHHFNCSEFTFLFNNEPKPLNSFRFNFAEGKKEYIRALSSLYNSINISNTNESILIHRDTYEKCFVLCQDLTSAKTSLTNISSGLSNSSLGFRINFSTPLPKAISIVFYLLVPSRFSINSNREVKLIY